MFVSMLHHVFRQSYEQTLPIFRIQAQGPRPLSYRRGVIMFVVFAIVTLKFRTVHVDRFRDLPMEGRKISVPGRSDVVCVAEDVGRVGGPVIDNYTELFDKYLNGVCINWTGKGAISGRFCYMNESFYKENISLGMFSRWYAEDDAVVYVSDGSTPCTENRTYSMKVRYRCVPSTAKGMTMYTFFKLSKDQCTIKAAGESSYACQAAALNDRGKDVHDIKCIEREKYENGMRKRESRRMEL